MTSYGAIIAGTGSCLPEKRLTNEDLSKMVDTYAAAQIERDLGKSWEEYKREGNGYRYSLQALPDIHLDPANIEAKLRPGGNLNYVYFLIFVAALILIIACINSSPISTIARHSFISAQCRRLQATVNGWDCCSTA